LIKAKQIQGLENLESLALISASQAADGTVTLTRGDGATLSFATGAGLDGSTGDKGPKGDKGPDGLGAYEMAVAGGYSGTEAQWRASLKGDTGNSGTAGANGAQGPAGITPTFQTTVSVSSAGVGANPTITRNTVTDTSTTKTYSLIMKIPQGKAGSNTSNGTSYAISTTGNITKSSTKAASAAAASISWSGTTGTVNITVPTGNTGDNGANTTGGAGSTPTFSSVSKGADLGAGSTEWICTRGGTPNGGATTYSIRLSKAATGDKGAKGPTGANGQSSSSYCGSYRTTNSDIFLNTRNGTIPNQRTAIFIYYEKENNVDAWFDFWIWKKTDWNNFIGLFFLTQNFAVAPNVSSGDEYGGFYYLFGNSWYEFGGKSFTGRSSMIQLAADHPCHVTHI